MYFSVILFAVFASTCLSVDPSPTDEPAVRSNQHYRHFLDGILNVYGIWRHAPSNQRLTVISGQRTTMCGSESVPVGQYDIGFEQFGNDPSDLRKTFVHVTFNPRHLDQGKPVSENVRKWVQKNSLRRAHDQSGHALAKALGGSGGRCNVFIQDGQLNNNAWKNKEEIVRDFLFEGVHKDGRTYRIDRTTGKYVPMDDRYVSMLISFEYCAVGQVIEGVECSDERPYKFSYVFFMHKGQTDDNPNVLAGTYLNRSYMKEWFFNVPGSAPMFKDEPAYASSPLLHDDILAYTRQHVG